MPRHKLADAAKSGQWKTVMQILDIYPRFVSQCHPAWVKAGYTVLHQAAKLRAHRLVFDYLIAIPDCDLGQQTVEGKNSYQIAMESPVPDPYVIAKLGGTPRYSSKALIKTSLAQVFCIIRYEIKSNSFFLHVSRTS